MTAVLLLLSIVVSAFVAGGVVWWLLRQNRPAENSMMPLLIDMKSEINLMRSRFQDQITSLSDQMSSHWQENARFLQESQAGFHQTVGNVHDRLGQLQQAAQNMQQIGQDIASLQDILRAPKLRGGLGELLLSELLRQILPEDHFSLQYGFQDGSIVDAVIILGQGMIPVDAKFPLENFRRLIEADDELDAHAYRKQFVTDVKKHVDQIAKKYILPEAGTFDFALMYIPAENVYYETIIKDENKNESIAEYALNKKVIPVSPNSFYAYLQAIVRGLRGLKIESSARKILENLAQLEMDLQKCMADFEKTGTHLANAQSAYQKAFRRFEKLQDKIGAIGDIRRSHLPEISAENP